MIFCRTAYASDEANRGLLRDVTFAGRINAIQQINKPLAGNLRHGLPYCLTEKVPIAGKANISIIDELKDVLGSAQNRNKARRALELSALSFSILSLAALRHDAGCCLDTCTEKALDRTVGASRWRVSELEVGLFDLALSVEAERKVLDGDRLTSEHPVKHRLKDLAGFRPDFHAGTTQRGGMLAPENGYERIVIEPRALRSPTEEHRLLRR